MKLHYNIFLCKLKQKNVFNEIKYDKLYPSAGLEKLGFLVCKSLCSPKQVQENVVHLNILCTLQLFMLHKFTSLCTLLCTKWNSYGKMKQYNKILQFPHISAERLSKKKKPRFGFPWETIYNLAVIISELGLLMLQMW